MQTDATQLTCTQGPSPGPCRSEGFPVCSPSHVLPIFDLATPPLQNAQKIAGKTGNPSLLPLFILTKYRPDNSPPPQGETNSDWILLWADSQRCWKKTIYELLRGPPPVSVSAAGCQLGILFQCFPERLTNHLTMLFLGACLFFH
jgi:hypothetical protein